ncbi:glycoside hydrolase family 57 protein [uncultured Desulfovibrio sp.]|jgi:alpha-amylase|uniref:glycoside hydrolase family 57 protein n=1 Tax=Desulfovibrio legallii TaxID=571438 RepID=UPI0022053D39|nr:glycoside hydrolase family 57 protein [uncultured Desulfovibrio sp.]CAI3234707.1 Alpha-amylase (EC [Desulfovibrio diazotrophicus]
MPALCLCFEVHEPYQLRRYTVFDMGQNSLYEDDDRNCETLLRAARLCYLPANELMLRLIRRYKGAFRLAFSISGTALDLFEQYAPEVLDSFKALAATGCVEFLGETSAHSLAFLYSGKEFEHQVRAQAARLQELFGAKPVSFKHTECIYNNDLAAALPRLGFKTVLAEGADHVLGWRSPNYLYSPAGTPKMALLLRNASLSADMGRRFGDRAWSGWPLTADKFAAWCHGLAGSAQVITLCNDYHLLGLRFSKETGIFDFMEALPKALLADHGFTWSTPAEVSATQHPVGEVDAPQFLSWEDEGRDLTTWLGNDMQKDAIHALYSLAPRVRRYADPELAHDFERLQTADHFAHMSTKWFAHPLTDRPNPFGSPYDAYITYMNVLADFEMRLDAAARAKASRARSARAKAGHDKPAPGADAASAKGRRNGKPVTRP